MEIFPSQDWVSAKRAIMTLANLRSDIYALWMWGWLNSSNDRVYRQIPLELTVFRMCCSDLVPLISRLHVISNNGIKNVFVSEDPIARHFASLEHICRVLDMETEKMTALADWLNLPGYKAVLEIAGSVGIDPMSFEHWFYVRMIADDNWQKIVIGNGNDHLGPRGVWL